MKTVETAINWFYERKGKVTYSMSYRNGPNSYDCSSAVYYALKSAGIFSQSKGIGNTDSLFGDLESAGWSSASTRRRGCIFIWGRRGASGGRYGHTGMFINENDIIHCTSSGNGIVVANYNTARSNAGSPPQTIYWNNNLVEEVEDDAEEPVMLQNIGELTRLGIDRGKVFAEGWHYSYDKTERSIEFINAVTGATIARVTPHTVVMPELAEEYPDQTNIANSGFYAEISVPSGTSVYVKGILRGSSGIDELIFDGIITYEEAFDIEKNDYASKNRSFFYEIYKQNKIVYRGNKVIANLSWHNELMYVPTMTMELPITLAEYIEGREEIKVYINYKLFHGMVTQYELDKVQERLILTLTHVIGEWEYRQISTNLAAKNRRINDLYSTLDFRYPGWNMNFLQDSARRIIDYVYSRQDKLEGLTKTCELTDDLFWRVGFDFGRSLDIGTFGDKSPYTISTRPSGTYNIRMIDEPTIVHDYDSVINMATVYGEKSDSGMSSMSLREVYEDKDSQIPGFPVLILSNNINNERNYNYLGFTSLAPNNDIEYTILDEESIQIESGIVIEGTYAFNDLAPFNIDSEEITDEDRAKAAQMAYQAGVKMLRQSRRRYIMDIRTEEIPPDIKVGDMILCRYNNNLWNLDECSNYMKKVLSMNDYFYITAIDYDIDENQVETNTLRLEKFLHTQRETSYQ